MPIRTPSLILLATAAALAAGAASAQSSAEPAKGLEEIVVTAQKRAENLQEIPKQVQVVSTENLQNANVTSLADLGRIVAMAEVDMALEAAFHARFGRTARVAGIPELEVR